MKKVLTEISRIGVRLNMRPIEAQRVRHSNHFALVFGLIVFSYSAIFLLLGLPGPAKLALPFGFIFFACPLLNEFRLYSLCKFLVLLNSNSVIFVFAALLGRDAAVHFWYVAAAQTPFILFDVRNRRHVFTSVGFSIAALLFLWVTHFNVSFIPAIVVPPNVIKILSTTMILGSLVTAFSITYVVCLDYSHAAESYGLSQQLLEDHINALDASAIVAITDSAGKFLHVNDLFCEISGYSRVELLGKTHSLLKSGLHSQEFYQQMWRTISSKKVWRGEICNKTKDGKLYWVYSTINPIIGTDNNIQRYVAIRHEITKTKELQNQLIAAKEVRETELVRELKASQEQLIQAAKLVSLGEMTAPSRSGCYPRPLSEPDLHVECIRLSTKSRT